MPEPEPEPRAEPDPDPMPDPDPEPMGRFPDIEWALDADQTRSAIGGTALDLTEDDVREAITGIAR